MGFDNRLAFWVDTVSILTFPAVLTRRCDSSVSFERIFPHFGRGSAFARVSDLRFVPFDPARTGQCLLAEGMIDATHATWRGDIWRLSD